MTKTLKRINGEISLHNIQFDYPDLPTELFSKLAQSTLEVVGFMCSESICPGQLYMVTFVSSHEQPQDPASFDYRICSFGIGIKAPTNSVDERRNLFDSGESFLLNLSHDKTFNSIVEVLMSND